MVNFMKKIKLNKISNQSGINRYALVDDRDFLFLNQWNWTFRDGYAFRIVQKNNISKGIFMHRLINQTPDGLETDHINRNRLDNRRSNLRSVTHRQNNLNRGIASNNTSGKVGVSWSLTKRKWRAYITTNAKQIFLGYFDDINKAISARTKAELVYKAINI